MNKNITIDSLDMPMPQRATITSQVGRGAGRGAIRHGPS
jgi:hypothetical protein